MGKIYNDPKTPSQLRKALYDAQANSDDLGGEIAALQAVVVTADSSFAVDSEFILSDGTARKVKGTGVTFDTAGTLAANSDSRIASQKAVKTYVTAAIAASHVADGDYGDIVVSGSGTVWSFDSGVVSTFARTFLDDTSAAAVRTTLGLVIGTDVQAWDADLDALAGLTSAADKLPYFSGSHTAAVTTFTAFARTLLDDADAATMRSTLGLGTISTQDASNVTITGGSITGITDLAVADGGTGASTASGARTNLGLVIGTNVQAWDADLDALAAVTYSADTIPYFTGTHSASVTTLTTFGRSLIDDANAAAAQTTLGLVIGTNVQAWDADLDALAGVTSAADALPYFTGSHTATVTTLTSTARSLLDDTSTSAMRTTLGLAIGTDVQAWDADLDALAGVTYAADTIAYFTGAHAASPTTLTSFGRSLIDDATAANARTTLGLGTVSTLASDTDGTLAANSDSNVATQKAVKTYVDSHTLLATASKTANYTAASGDLVLCDVNTTGSFTVTLPTSPAANDEVGVLLSVSNTNRTVTISNTHSGSPDILGKSGSLGTSVLLYVKGDFLRFKYIGGDTWLITVDGRASHSCQLIASGSQNITNNTVTTVAVGTSTYDIGQIGNTGSNKITIRRAGVYEIFVNLGFDAPVLTAGTGIVGLSISAGGNTLVTQQINIANTSCYLGVSMQAKLAAGDDVTSLIFQNNGGTRATTNVGALAKLLVTEVR